MQVFNNGAFFTVTVTRREIAEFKQAWPCSGLSDKPVTFQFCKRNGDLIDSNDAANHPNAEGSAIIALASDAKLVGVTRLDLHT